MEYVRRGSTVGSTLPDREVVAGMFACRSGSNGFLQTVLRGVDGVDEEDFVGAALSATDAKALDDVTSGLSAGAPWERWCEASPVVVSFEGCAASTPLEKALEAELGVLEAVCHAPRMLLRYDEERVAVSRARRVSPRAVSDLVSRPADWEHRTLRGIRPARVLAVTTEDEVDLYENRMVARLIDRLISALTLRLDELREILALLAEGHDFTHETCGSHWRARRMSIAWARVQRSDELLAAIKSTHLRVYGLIRAVRMLTSSPLYQSVPRSAGVEDSLRVTNVLANDARYRRLAALWRRLVDARRESAGARADQVARRVASAERFDCFAFMLVAQALSNLGYSLVSEDGRSTRVRSVRGELRVSRESDGSVILEGGAQPLAVVALPVAASVEDLSPLWTALRTSGHRDALYLLYGRPGVLRVADECGADTRLGLSGWDAPRALLVSPWALDSVERVARVVGAWDAGGRLESFPPSVSTRAALAGEWTYRPAWLDARASGLSVTRPITQAERSAAIEALDRATPPREQARASPERERDQALRQLLEKSAELNWLTRCPVCERERVSIEGRGTELERLADRTFWCKCLECSAAWGLRRCGLCRARFAVLDDGVSVRCPDDVVDLDRVHGRDQWHPARSDAGKRDYRCTKCEPLREPRGIH
ncbi:MAG: DUF2357 domain-containing protein [Deltaproteobacteria bacterium]|nr:DUF2357 domain-containing protein [Deltaproteobacteria bacterium]